MDSSGAKKKTGDPGHRGSANAQTPPEREKADHRESQAREPKLAVAVKSERPRHVAEEDMENEVVEVGDPDREQKEVREEVLDDDGWP